MEEKLSGFTKKFVSGLEAHRKDSEKDEKIASIQAHKEEVRESKVSSSSGKLDFAAVLAQKKANTK